MKFYEFRIAEGEREKTSPIFIATYTELKNLKGYDNYRLGKFLRNLKKHKLIEVITWKKAMDSEYFSMFSKNINRIFKKALRSNLKVISKLADSSNDVYIKNLLGKQESMMTDVFRKYRGIDPRERMIRMTENGLFLAKILDRVHSN